MSSYSISGNNLRIKCPSCNKIMLEGSLNEEMRLDPRTENNYMLYSCPNCAEMFNTYEWYYDETQEII